MAWNDDGRYYQTTEKDLKRALQAKKERSFRADLALNNPKAWDSSLWNLIQNLSPSGENITEETALTYAAVFCAVTVYSGTISTLPLNLLQKKGKQNLPAMQKSVHWALHSVANPFMTAMALREVMVAHLLTWGNAYAEIVRNDLGDIIELWPIPPNKIRMEMKDWKINYWIRVNPGQEIGLPREKILHIPGLGFDGFRGYSIISMAKKSIGLGMAMETFGSLYFGSGTHPGMVITHPEQLSDTVRENIKETIAAANSGLGKSHRILLLEEGMKAEKITIPPNESQFLESRSFQIPEIARWFNLPPHKLKDLSRATWANIESEQINFVTDSLLPWLVRIEQNYNMQLLTDRERRQENLYFRHNVNGLLRGDATSRSNFYGKMFQVGAMSRNEIREKEDLDPVEGGDEYYVPLNMIPVSQLIKSIPQGKPINPSLPKGNGNGKDYSQIELFSQEEEQNAL